MVEKKITAKSTAFPELPFHSFGQFQWKLLPNLVKKIHFICKLGLFNQSTGRSSSQFSWIYRISRILWIFRYPLLFHQNNDSTMSTIIIHTTKKLPSSLNLLLGWFIGQFKCYKMFFFLYINFSKQNFDQNKMFFC